MPNKKELIGVIDRKNNLVNFSMIAQQFGIKNMAIPDVTIPDVISSLEKKKLVAVRNFGSSKIVMVRKK